jgi:hypothetical protein
MNKIIYRVDETWLSEYQIIFETEYKYLIKNSDLDVLLINKWDVSDNKESWSYYFYDLGKAKYAWNLILNQLRCKYENLRSRLNNII